MTMIDEKSIKEAIHGTLTEMFNKQKQYSAKAISKTKELIKEAMVLVPKVFALKTEYLSTTTKENHFKLYKTYVDSFNEVSTKLDTVGRNNASNPNDSDFRHLKLDEQHNLNGVKLHELYFHNISDVHSEIRANSIAYMRLSRDFGTFENWQFDFRACGMAAMEGWTILYFDPFKQKYLNVVVEKHTENIPLCGIPIIVVDTWHHSWFRDYPGDKVNYLNAMMKELNWNIIEARMIIAEKANLHQLFALQPVVNSMPEQMLANIPSNVPPINKDQVVKAELNLGTPEQQPSATTIPTMIPGKGQ